MKNDDIPIDVSNDTNNSYITIYTNTSKQSDVTNTDNVDKDCISNSSDDFINRIGDDICFTNNCKNSAKIGVKCEICKKKAKYSLSKYAIPTRCIEHKTKTMIKYHYNFCRYGNCLKVSNYGFLSEKKYEHIREYKIEYLDIPLYCHKHKQKNMYNLKKKICIYGTCDTVAKYGFKGHLPIFCKTHKTCAMYRL